MTTKKDGGQAFPRNNTGTAGSTEGMTLRDYFAAKAMPGLLANALENELAADGYDSFDGMIAEQAYELADAMLAERSAS